MLRLSDIIWAFWGFNCASNFAFLRPFLFCKGICKVHMCNGLEILVPKHLWKSKIGPIQLILATKCYVTFFLGHPVDLYEISTQIASFTTFVVESISPTKNFGNGLGNTGIGAQSVSLTKPPHSLKSKRHSLGFVSMTISLSPGPSQWLLVFPKYIAAYNCMVVPSN